MAALITTGLGLNTGQLITTYGLGGTPASINGPSSFTFTFNASTLSEIPNKGFINDTPEEIIRKHLSPGFSLYDKGWRALIDGLSAGDNINFTNAALTFDQLFISTASGIYLDRRCSDEGIIRPDNVGISDDIFRHLAIKVSTKKVVTQALLEALEIYYGTDSTRSNTSTDLAEPYNIQEGWDLRLSIDAGDEIQIPFTANDFEHISAGKAREVAAAITRQLSKNNSNAFAIEVTDAITGLKKVKIYSSALGLGSSIQVTGGRANNVLQFPSLTTQSNTSDAWNVSKPSPGVARYKTTGTTTLDLTLVQVGDYVNIFGTNFHADNKGTFTITAIDIRYNGLTLEQYFEIKNDFAVVQSGVITATTSDLMFYRPKINTINDNGSRSVIVSQNRPREVDVQLPATTIAVVRTAKSGAYLNSRTPLIISSLVRNSAGTVTVTTTTGHNLSVGNQIYIDNIFPSNSSPTRINGDGVTTTDASSATILSRLQDMPGNNTHSAEAAALANNKVLVTGGHNYSSLYATNLNVQADARLFDIPSSATLPGGATQYTYNWSSATPIPVAREFHKLTALSNSVQAGNALLTGGWDGDEFYGGIGTATVFDTAYLYNTSGNTWSSAITMTNKAAQHQATQLIDGRVLITGGAVDKFNGTTACQVYDPTTSATGTFSSVASMVNQRVSHQAVRLLNGDILVIGGRKLGVEATIGGSLALWHFNELAGNSAADSSGNGYSLTGVGAPIIVDGKLGKARNFTPAASYMTAVGNAGASAALLGEWSVEFWTTKSTNATTNKTYICYSDPGELAVDNALMHVGIDSTGHLFSRWENGIGVDVLVTVPITITAILASGNVPSDDDVYIGGGTPYIHIGVVKKADSTGGTYNITFYINGYAAHIQTGLANASGGSTSNWYLALDPETTNYFGNDYIDDLRVSNVARTSDEIYNTFIGGWGRLASNSNGIQVGKVTSTCEIYSPGTNTWSNTGSMSYSRVFHQAVTLPNNQILVIGGWGHPLSLQTGTSKRWLKECEIYDGNTGRWYPAPSMQSERKTDKFGAVYLPNKNEVIVIGGEKTTSGSGTDITGVVEIYDVGLGQWKAAPDKLQYTNPLTAPLTDTYQAIAATLIPNRNVILIAGGYAYNTGSAIYQSTKQSKLYIPGSDIVSSGGLNNYFRIESVPTGTTFTFKTPNFPFATINSSTTATATPISAAAAPTNLPGPFIFNVDGGPAITNVSTVLTSPISAGVQYQEISVSSTTGFPDEERWLVFGFGTSVEIFPVKYLGNLSSTKLSLDYGQVFTQDLPIGTAVILLQSKGPFVPVNPEDIGSFYLTDSNSGRIAAQNTLDAITAAGIILNKNVIYPGDLGLGAYGFGSIGTKLSDKVEIWSGNDIDHEINNAHGGD